MNFQDNAPGGMKGLVNGLNDAIRDNPLAAGLLGAGVAWMLFGNSRTLAMGGKIAGGVQSVAGAVGDGAAAGVTSARAGFAAAGSQLAGAARQAAAAVTDAMASASPAVDTDRNGGGLSDSVAHAADAVRERVRTSAQSGMEYGDSLKKTLSENLERQPLLLGAIGLAIGAGLASAFPSTAIEGELVGASGAAARDKLEGLASEAKSRATQVFEDVKQEAQLQGLTTSAAKDALSDVADKVKSVAGSARHSVSSRIS